MKKLKIWFTSALKHLPPPLDFLYALYKAWGSEHLGQMAAAMAYFGIFSVAPLIFVGFTLAGLVVQQVATYSHFYMRVENALGPGAANWLRGSVEALGAKTFGGSTIVSIVSFLALLYAASGLFLQIQFALNSIFKVPHARRIRKRSYILQKFFSILMVIGVGLLTILATFFNVTISWLGSLFDGTTGAGVVLNILDRLALFGLITISFALIYKILPDADIFWRDVWPGAALAALVVLIAGALLGFYFRFAGLSSALEAAGTFAVILIAFNIFAQIFMFGALFIREYTLRFGSGKRQAANSDG
jgi:membrane protein